MWWVCAKKCVCKNFPHYMAIRHTVIFVETAFWTFEFEFNWRIVWIKLLSWSFFLSSASRWLTKSKTKKPQLFRQSRPSFRDDTWRSRPEWWCLACFDHYRHAELHFLFCPFFIGPVLELLWFRISWTHSIHWTSCSRARRNL